MRRAVKGKFEVVPRQLFLCLVLMRSHVMCLCSYDTQDQDQDEGYFVIDVLVGVDKEFGAEKSEWETQDETVGRFHVGG